MLPHRLARLCALAGARLVHISTDCVFAGTRGDYREADPPDAQDLYGRSKLLGEVDARARDHACAPPSSATSSAGAHGLVGWFLAQRGTVRGYTPAVFSGLPTVELARVDPRPRAAAPAAARRSTTCRPSRSPSTSCCTWWRRPTAPGRLEIVPDDRRRSIDRSLDSAPLLAAPTGYRAAAAGPELVRTHARQFG